MPLKRLVNKVWSCGRCGYSTSNVLTSSPTGQPRLLRGGKRAFKRDAIGVDKSLWLLKNSLPKNPQKLKRVRELHKRFFLVGYTFSPSRFSGILRKRDFFNSHSRYHK